MLTPFPPQPELTGGGEISVPANLSGAVAWADLITFVCDCLGLQPTAFVAVSMGLRISISWHVRWFLPSDPAVCPLVA